MLAAVLTAADVRPLLTEVAAVRSLPRSEAEKKIAVHLRGVITTRSGWTNSFFLQDSTAGIAVDLVDKHADFHAGEVVEVEGVSEPGSFAPSVLAERVKVVGHGAFPKPTLFRMRDLTGGNLDSQ